MVEPRSKHSVIMNVTRTCRPIFPIEHLESRTAQKLYDRWKAWAASAYISGWPDTNSHRATSLCVFILLCGLLHVFVCFSIFVLHLMYMMWVTKAYVSTLFGLQVDLWYFNLGDDMIMIFTSMFNHGGRQSRFNSFSLKPVVGDRVSSARSFS